MRAIYLILLTVLVFSSCQYEEAYTFKKNWKGMYKSTLDVSGMEPSKDNELIPRDEAEDIENRMNAIEGISGARIIGDVAKSVINFSFNFENLEAVSALNKADLSAKDDSPLDGIGKWKMWNKGKKKFYMEMIELDEFRQNMDEEDAKRAGETLKIKTTLTFYRDVKKLTSQMAKNGEKSNQIVFEYSPYDMWNKENKWYTEVKL